MLESRWSRLTLRTSLFWISLSVWPKFGVCCELVPPTRRDAKNASTTTIRIGKAALLKKRLMISGLTPGCRRLCGSWRSGGQRPSVASRHLLPDRVADPRVAARRRLTRRLTGGLRLALRAQKSLLEQGRHVGDAQRLPA